MAKTRERTSNSMTRLESVEISGFRSCKQTHFEPNADLSALIGINGTGKTNILQAIRLIGRKPHGIDRGPRGVDSRALARITAWLTVGSEKIGVRITFATAEGLRSNDLIPLEEVWSLPGIDAPNKTWRMIPPLGFVEGDIGTDEVFGVLNKRFYLGWRKYQQTKIDFEIIENKQAVDLISAVEKFRRGISYYSASQFIDATRCPGSFEIDETGRLVDAYGYFHNSIDPRLKFVHDLYMLRSANSVLYEEYCSFVSRRQLGLVSRLTWREVELSSSTAEVKTGGSIRKVRKKKRLVIPKVQVGRAHITFNQLSEGTFKTLALIFYVMTDASGFLMVEEPEVCVHHGLLSKIIDTIKAYAPRKQIVISTHSDLLVDELESRNLFVVQMTSSGTKVEQLEKWLGKKGTDALNGYLLESGPLGEYWRSGGLNQ